MTGYFKPILMLARNITFVRYGESAVNLFLNGSGVFRYFAEYLARMSVFRLYPDF